MKEHGICAKCKKSVGCPYADDRITGCKNFVLEHELKLTNKEWIRQCATEQLAEFLFRIAYMCSYCGDEAHSSQEKMQQCHFEKCGCQRKDWVVWLKQPHREG